MTRIGLIGAKGFVGSAIAHELQQHSDLALLPVIRGQDWQSLLGSADVIIYAANSGRRVFAEQNAQVDYENSVLQVDRLRHLFPKKKLVLISSISARTQLNTVYGRHRHMCELLMDEQKDLIVRLGPMFGGNKKAGALYDILAGRKVYQSAETQYGYVPVEYNARKIIELRNEIGLLEIGARNGIRLGEIAEKLHSNCQFSGSDDTQIAINPPADAPDAYDVIAHATTLQISSGELQS